MAVGASGTIARAAESYRRRAGASARAAESVGPADSGGSVGVMLTGTGYLAARSAEASRALSEAASARVSFTATTTDHLGFLGRTEGLLAVATALVYPVPDAGGQG